MMRKGVFFSLLLAFCLAVSFPVSAQNGRWDSALDQYEAICDRCIELRTLSLSGQAVSAEALSSLLLQLSSLRQQLQTAEGEMTPAQRSRFIMIRNRYQGHTAPRQRSHGHLQPLQATGPNTLPLLSPGPVFRNPDPMPLTQPRSSEMQGGVLLFAGIPDGYPGLMGFLQWKRWGGYVKGAFTLGSAHSDYTGLSDGTSGGSVIWTTGEEKLHRRSVSAGILASLTEHLRIYGGPNYGSRDILWEDVSGNWMSVSDLGHKGWGADAGLLLSWKHFSLMTGVSYARGCPLQTELGIGFLF